jgi:colanic acid/amylovoran biosynthesis glycosyltransferase
MNLVITQSLATGLPVIGTRHSGLPDQIVDGQNGYLVDEGDYEALAERIIYYMDHPELWPGMSRFGREHVKENYDSEKLINKQIGFYKEVLGI